MKKSVNAAYGLLFLIPLALSILFFMWIPGERRGIIEWLSYVFMILSFVSLCLFMPKESDETYTITVGDLTMKFFLLQVGSAFAFIILSQLLGWYDNAFRTFPCLMVLTVYLVLTVVYVIRIGIHALANRATKASLDAGVQSSNISNTLKTKVASLMFGESDPAAAKALKKLQETIKFCPIGKFSDAAFVAELYSGISELERAAEAKDWDAVVKLSDKMIFTCKG